MDLLFKEESYAIVGAAMEVHRQLGIGFTEYVYQDALEVEFKNRGIPYEREKHCPVTYKGVVLEHSYIADFICYDSIAVELKSAKALTDEHRAQLINYLRAGDKQLGLLLNFGELHLVQERFVRQDGYIKRR